MTALVELALARSRMWRCRAYAARATATDPPIGILFLRQSNKELAEAMRLARSIKQNREVPPLSA